MFKGEEKNFAEIAPGTPIELPEDAKKRHGLKIGLFFGAQKYDAKVYATLMGWDGPRERFVQIPSNPLDKDTFRVLTGTSKGLLEAKMKARYTDMIPRPQAECTGTDPEIFAVDAKGNLLPAFTFLDSKHSGKMQYWDGFQAEFRTEPKSCLERLSEKIQAGLYAINSLLTIKHPGSRLTLKNTFEIPPEMLLNAANDHVAFGCEPSFNIYNEESPLILDPRLFPLRSAGGHIHGQIHKPTQAQIKAAMYSLDGILGVAGVSLAQGIDTPERRKLYGRAGEFRLPKYGIEYRVLSNFWLMDPSIYYLTFELFRLALGVGLQGLYSTIWDVDQDRVREVINNCDVKGAQAILTKNKQALTWLLRSRWANASYGEVGAEVILRGAGNIIKNPEDIVNNWGTRTTWAQRAYDLERIKQISVQRNSAPVATGSGQPLNQARA